MKLKYTLAAAALALTTAAQAQTWIADTANMGASYANNIYYSLANGTVKSEAANNWDLAFRIGGRTVGVYANHAVNGLKVYPLTGVSAATSFGTDLTADTAGVLVDSNALYNSIETWEAGAFNMNADFTNVFDYGWGTYDISTHFITGDKIYIVTTPAATYQVWIEQDQATLTNAHWKFHVAKLDGSGATTKEFDTNPDYADKLFAYYNFATGEMFGRDPANDAWDFVLTKYTEAIPAGPTTVMYPVTGVLLNQNRGVYRLTGANAQGAAWDSASMMPHLDSTINIIGREFKGSTNANAGYDIKDTLSYFVNVANGDVWQVEFTYATQGNTTSVPGVNPGLVGLRKRKVYTKPVTPPPTSIKEVNDYVNNMIVVPNPAVSGNTNLLIDAKQALKGAQISVTDLSGRVLLNTTRDIQSGLRQVPLDVAQYPAGIYVIRLSGAGFSATQKLVIK